MNKRFRFPVIALVLCTQTSIASLRASATPPDKPFAQKIPGTDVTFEMVPIPAGKFLIGSPASEKGRKADEGPQFEVQVDPFWMGRYVVTWPQYNAFLANFDRLAQSGVKVLRDKWADAVTFPSPEYQPEMAPVLTRMGWDDGYPAVAMSQYAARQYTKWLSKKTGRFYRLPTEAEWEYACRAGTTTAYNFGDDPGALREHAWFVDSSNLKDGDPAYRKVGTLPANAWGLFDMHGNVAQWCIDQYDPVWYAKFKGKSVNWHDCVNWPAHRYPVVVRGGGYESEADECRSASRLHSSKAFNFHDPRLPQRPHWEFPTYWVGFRLVSPANEPTEAQKHQYWDAGNHMTQERMQDESEESEIRELISPPGKAK